MEKAELYAVVGGAFTVITALTGLAYASVIERIKRNEALREKDMGAVWDAIDEQRADTKKILTGMVTKEDLARNTEQLIRVLKPGRAG
jgi:hypothetical protein